MMATMCKNNLKKMANENHCMMIKMSQMSFHRSIWRLFGNDSGSSLPPNRLQTTFWINADPGPYRRYASPGIHALINHLLNLITISPKVKGWWLCNIGYTVKRQHPLNIFATWRQPIRGVFIYRSPYDVFSNTERRVTQIMACRCT